MNLEGKENYDALKLHKITVRKKKRRLAGISSIYVFLFWFIFQQEAK